MNLANQGVVTSRGAVTDNFALAFIKAIAQHRHWERETEQGNIDGLTELSGNDLRSRGWHLNLKDGSNVLIFTPRSQRGS